MKQAGYRGVMSRIFVGFIGVFVGLLLSVQIAGAQCGNNPTSVFTNCSFETADFTGWVTQDLSSPFIPLQVIGAGFSAGYGFFSTAPTDGVYAALHGFDGNGPGDIIIAQDVTLPVGDNVVLSFDYRAAWDLSNFGATQDRIFWVDVEPTGGGTPLYSKTILTAVAGDINTDTGDLTGTVNLTSFDGQSIRISFRFNIPESFTGPAQFQLDNVQTTATIVHPVPTINEWGTIILSLLLGAYVIWYMRRQSHRKSIT